MSAAASSGRWPPVGTAHPAGEGPGVPGLQPPCAPPTACPRGPPGGPGPGRTVRMSLMRRLHAPLPHRAPAALPGVPVQPRGFPRGPAARSPRTVVRVPRRPKNSTTRAARRAMLRPAPHSHNPRSGSSGWQRRERNPHGAEPAAGVRRCYFAPACALAPPAATPTQRPGMWARGAGRGRAGSPRRPRCRSTTPTLLGKV